MARSARVAGSDPLQRGPRQIPRRAFSMRRDQSFISSARLAMPSILDLCPPRLNIPPRSALSHKAAVGGIDPSVGDGHQRLADATTHRWVIEGYQAARRANRVRPSRFCNRSAPARRLQAGRPDRCGPRTQAPRAARSARPLPDARLRRLALAARSAAICSTGHAGGSARDRASVHRGRAAGTVFRWPAARSHPTNDSRGSACA